MLLAIRAKQLSQQAQQQHHPLIKLLANKTKQKIVHKYVPVPSGKNAQSNQMTLCKKHIKLTTINTGEKKIITIVAAAPAVMKSYGDKENA